MRLIVYIFLASVSTLCFSQNKLFLCANYNNDGTYTGAYTSWNIQKNGNFMYLFYESATPIYDTLFVRIDKNFNRKDTNYYEYDHYYLIPDVSKKWAVNKYTFTKTGKYKITVYNRNGDRIAQPHFTNIDFSEFEYNDFKFVDSWYYNQSHISFFEKAIGDSMFGKSNVFKLQPVETKVTLYIEQENKRAFKTTHLFVSIYNDEKCHERINSYTYYVDETWHWTFIPVFFKQKGKYTVELYNDDDVFINSGKLEIK